MKSSFVASLLTVLLFTAGAVAALAVPIHVHAPRVPIHHAFGARAEEAPWIEGVTPSLENQLFDATYRVLPKHNVLKVYVFDAAGYQSAGIRFSGRVPHEPADLSVAELNHEAAELVRTTFERFPELQTVDVWATIPIPSDEATTVDSTVFSVSADRPTYESIKDDGTLSDEQFLAAFGRVWIAPEVPQ